MRFLSGLLALALAFALATLPVAASPFKNVFPEQAAAVPEEYRAQLEAMELRQGKIELSDGNATLDVPKGYYFLDPKDGRFVLESMWGNPPSVGTLGMLFPIDKSPLDDTWGIEIYFDDMGYVSDADATTMDYDAILKQLQDEAEAANEERSKSGFAAVTVKGWAATPRYDAVERKLFWAKQLHFEGDDADVLNYNIRALGRKGVLVMNFVAGIDQLAQVEAATPDVLKMVSFTEGNRYSDYLPGVDTVAAVGIGGLIAGKVAAKAGLLILLLAFLKKGFVLVLLPLIWLKNKLFGGKPQA